MRVTGESAINRWAPLRSSGCHWNFMPVKDAGWLVVRVDLIRQG